MDKEQLRQKLLDAFTDALADVLDEAFPAEPLWDNPCIVVHEVREVTYRKVDHRQVRAGDYYDMYSGHLNGGAIFMPAQPFVCRYDDTAVLNGTYDIYEPVKEVSK
jgi:hypothetical protein